MTYENFYTGEAVPSPVAEKEAESFASFGKYGYDPNYTNQMNGYYQPNNIPPQQQYIVGGYGYNTYPPQQQQNIGLGANPAMYNNYYSNLNNGMMNGYGCMPQQQQPYYPQQQIYPQQVYPQQQIYPQRAEGVSYSGGYIQQPSYGGYQPMNHNYFLEQQMINNNRQPMYGSYTGFVPVDQMNPVIANNSPTSPYQFIPGPGSRKSGMYSKEDVEEFKKLERDMKRELDELEVRLIAEFNTQFTGNGYDLVYQYDVYRYGIESSKIISKYDVLMSEINQRAINARRDFDLRLRKHVHHYLKDGMSDEDIEKYYDGYYVEKKKFTGYDEGYNKNMFSSKEEYDDLVRHNQMVENSIPISDAELTYKYRIKSEQQFKFAQQYITPNCKDLKQFFDQANQYIIAVMLDEEDKRRMRMIGGYRENYDRFGNLKPMEERTFKFHDIIKCFRADKKVKEIIKRADPNTRDDVENLRHQGLVTSPLDTMSAKDDTPFFMRALDVLTANPSPPPLPSGLASNLNPPNTLGSLGGDPFAKQSVVPPSSPFDDDGTALNPDLVDTGPNTNINPEDFEIICPNGMVIMSRAARMKKKQQEMERLLAQEAAEEAMKEDNGLPPNDPNSTKYIPGSEMFPILAESGTTLNKDGSFDIRCGPYENTNITIDEFGPDIDKEDRDSFRGKIEKSLALRPLRSGLLKNEVPGADNI